MDFFPVFQILVMDKKKSPSLNQVFFDYQMVIISYIFGKKQSKKNNLIASISGRITIYINSKIDFF